MCFPYGDKPFSSFQFRYRSRKDLQIEGIIEKDPESVPLEDRDAATLTAEDVRQLQRQLQFKRDDIVKIKKEKRAWVNNDGTDDDEAELVNDGRSHKKRKPTETIDLTED